MVLSFPPPSTASWFWTTETLRFLVGGVLVLSALALLFVALVLALRFRNQRVARRREELEKAWASLFPRLAEGQGKEASAWLGSLPPRDRLFLLEVLYRYSRRLKGEERERLRDLASPFLPLLLARLRGGREEERARAVQVIGELGLPSFQDPLREALEDRSSWVAMVAVRELVRGRCVGQVEAIVACLGRFWNWRRPYLAGLLAKMGPEAAPTLRAVLEDEARGRWERALAADALAMLPDPAAADSAAEVLEGVREAAGICEGRMEERISSSARSKESEVEVAAACLRILARVGNTRHRPVVLPFATSPHPVLRALAFRALGGLGEPADAALLEAGLGDPSPWAALEAARALQRLGGEERLLSVAAEGRAPMDVLAQEVLQSWDG